MKIFKRIVLIILFLLILFLFIGVINGIDRKIYDESLGLLAFIVFINTIVNFINAFK